MAESQQLSDVYIKDGVLTIHAGQEFEIIGYKGFPIEGTDEESIAYSLERKKEKDSINQQQHF